VGIVLISKMYKKETKIIPEFKDFADSLFLVANIRDSISLRCGTATNYITVFLCCVFYKCNKRVLFGT
jgi:hypothetical protein